MRTQADLDDHNGDLNVLFFKRMVAAMTQNMQYPEG